jgi:hypothetical protein
MFVRYGFIDALTMRDALELDAVKTKAPAHAEAFISRGERI